MIAITDKKKCCGCGACAQKCPYKCITLKEDEEGFLYPFTNLSLCTNCKICEIVCPVINQGKPKSPLKVYAAKNPNEQIRLKSSSGGIFSSLTEYVIHNNGVVFGAKFNTKWEVVHDYIEKTEDITSFHGSKYVQSKIDLSYQKAEAFLKQKRLVLFSGTPCQIRGLKLFLRKEYQNLICVDFICHGVPSPKVWKIYLNYLMRCKNIDGKRKTITDIQFRDKKSGWKKFSFKVSVSNSSNHIHTIVSQSLYDNPYIIGFLSDLYLRPSCYECPTKSLKSNSDITIADFWGIEHVFPQWDDNKGVSSVLLNTEYGMQIFNDLNLQKRNCDYQEICKLNSAIHYSAKEHLNRSYFFSVLDKYKNNITKLILTNCCTLSQRTKRTIRLILIYFNLYNK